jgi:hypothetical protein
MADLQKIVTDLCEHANLTEIEITEKLAELGVKTSQPTINRLRNGAVQRASFDVGTALVKLHEKLVPRALH